MLLTLHSTDLFGSTELQITCDCLHQHSLTQHVKIEHSNQQLLYHQCLHILWLTQHTQVPCMSKHSICEGLVRRQMRWIQNI